MKLSYLVHDGYLSLCSVGCAQQNRHELGQNNSSSWHSTTFQKGQYRSKQDASIHTCSTCSASARVRDRVHVAYKTAQCITSQHLALAIELCMRAYLRPLASMFQCCQVTGVCEINAHRAAGRAEAVAPPRPRSQCCRMTKGGLGGCEKNAHLCATAGSPQSTQH